MPYLLYVSLLFIFHLAPGPVDARPPRRVALIVGAAGEERASFETAFDEGIRALLGKGFEVSVLYGGASQGKEKVRDEQLSKTLGKRIPAFSKANFDGLLARTLADAQPGDYVLLIVDTHGWNPDGDTEHGTGPTQSHFVQLGAPETEDLNLDAARPFRDALKAKKAAFALVDFSCNSGCSLSLADDFACVITSNPRAGIASRFEPAFWEGIRRADNLEDAFLIAVRNYNLPREPQISSPAGLKAAEIIHLNHGDPSTTEAKPPFATDAAFLARLKTEIGDRFDRDPDIQAFQGLIEKYQKQFKVTGYPRHLPTGDFPAWGRLESAAYLRLYETYSSQESYRKQPNPCRKFSLGEAGPGAKRHGGPGDPPAHAP